MIRKNIPDAKIRILQAAIQVFAEKSFAGSRVDEIAQVANVPKSVIYYHFKSKDEILEVLIQKFVRDYLELIAIAENDTHQTKARELAERIQTRYSRFEESNADLIRIIMIESLKKSNKKPVIFKIVEALIDKENTFSGLENWNDYDRQERLVAEFFTNIIPNYAYICFRDAWTNYFGIKQEGLSKLFVKVFMATHGAYHKYHE
ncbi:AcrR family transcriptional regulator [Sporomusaceae bacterium BoRhaA]|uniref:TetR/AcrR family transcriptional regulator n=1 Tax=Pelorhabdus rhamnosifermentans TaxID=2772457 RepID=UPI001C05EE30|nr:TetR/AcrR family transcriptional regulator [Pelorhabdus rhamnosifermentans]MBU2699991.1 AcrR family transcriptional regulator [Pelorhabdus rhamnosifermentans]